MRYLILSDIHANWQALEAVLADAEGHYDHIICCGDLVGYGPDPNEVVHWARKNLHRVIRGNHDKAAVGLDDLEWFNPFAKAATLYTMQVMNDGTREYLVDLPEGPLEVEDFQISHGSPRNEDEYLVSAGDVGFVAGSLVRPVTFFGHTHLQGGFLCHRYGVLSFARRRLGRKWDVEIEPDQFYLLNPGSVGQPRDGDPRAAYALYSPEERLVQFLRVKYDIPLAQQRVLSAGLPPILADRLAAGC